MDNFLWILLVVDVFFLLLTSVYLLLNRKRDCPKKQQIDPWASREWDPANKELHYDSYEDLIDALEKYKEE